MKVLQVNSVCGVGSTGRIALDIHELLIKLGHESYVAYGRKGAKRHNNSIKIGNKLDILLHAMITRLFDLHGFGSKRATIDFIKKVKIIDPDIIHIHNIHGYYLNFEILFDFLKKSDIPIVWTLHDCWSFTGHCAYFDYASCDKWKKLCFECPEKKEYPKSLIIDNSKKNYLLKHKCFTNIKRLTIVTPSNWLKNKVNDSFLNIYPVNVINNGIDLTVFRPTNSDFRVMHGIENSFMILGVASLWGKRKGLSYFIELSEYIDEDEVIVLVGLTNKQVLSLPKKIIGITQTDNVKELAEIYSSADVFVNPTLEDNYPTTNLEALACGTPVITFNTGGSPESINASNGLITSNKNTIDLLVSIKEIRKNLYYYENSIDKLKHNKEYMLSQYIELYQESLVK